MNRFLILFLVVLPGFLAGQDQIVLDSLELKLKHAKQDSVKVAILRDLWNYSSKTNLSKSLDYALQALEIAKKSDDMYSVGRSYTEVGVAYFRIGNYEESLENHLKGVEILKSLRKEKEIIAAYNNLGILYDRLEKYDAALECYFNALNIYNEKKVQNKSLEGLKIIHRLYNNIGNIYEVKNDYRNAQQYYTKGLDIALKVGDYYGQGLIYNNLGKLFLKMERYDEAEEYLQKSLEAREKNKDIVGVAKTYYVFCDLYTRLNNFDKALDAANKSLQLAKKVGALEVQMIAAKFLFTIYEKEGDFEKAFQSHRFYKEISDSLMNERTIRELTQVQMQHEFEKKKKSLEAEQQKRELKYVLIISILALGFVITGLLYSLLKNRTRRIQLEKNQLHLEKANLEKDLEIKNKELTTNVLYLIKKNELISGICNRMLKLKSRLKPENIESFQKIIYDLNANVDQDVWEEFEVRFQMIHSEFYEKLQKEYPDLTPSERKLAAFLRLNMTTKEISSITGQSPRSLEVARYRLRKKLGLESRDVNLINFLCDL